LHGVPAPVPGGHGTRVGRRCHVRPECRMVHGTAQRWDLVMTTDRPRQMVVTLLDVLERKQNQPTGRVGGPELDWTRELERKLARGFRLSIPACHAEKSVGWAPSQREGRASSAPASRVESNSNRSWKPSRGDPASSHVACTSQQPFVPRQRPVYRCSPVLISIPYPRP